MKKLTTSFVLLLLTLCLLLSGCENHGATLLTAGNGDIEVSVNVFQLYLSRMKGSLHAAGEKVNDPSYWATITNLEEQTLAEYYTEFLIIHSISPPYSIISLRSSKFLCVVTTITLSPRAM